VNSINNPSHAESPSHANSSVIPEARVLVGWPASSRETKLGLSSSRGWSEIWGKMAVEDQLPS